MHRFFVTPEWLAQERAYIKGGQAHQIFHVLRLKPGDHITLLDNGGWEYEVEIQELNGELVRGKILNKSLCSNEPRFKITLYLALLKSDKLEFVLQKGVEIGVSAFVPFTCERCVVSKPGDSKIDRWRKIVREAAEQSKRCLLPLLHPAVTFQRACEQAGSTSMILWEAEERQSLSTVLRSHAFKNADNISLFIGPEGGFTASEVEYAGAHGIIPVGLGRRILRAETAGLAAVSAVLYERGELG